jgi:uncharacterized protein YprB with RNaseH-like and TPR domain
MTKKPIELRCIHRHTIKEHPKCFAEGKIKYEFRDEKEFERLTGLPWYQYPGTRIGYMDIETDNFNADFGTVLSWSIKLKGGDTKVSVIDKNELFKGLYDERLVREFVDEIYNYDIIVTYYGTGFDFPFMRAKALHYGMDFPGYVLKERHDGKYFAVPELYHFDMYYVVKSKLKISKRSLDNACDYLNIKGKTPIDKSVWRAAKYGDPKALKEVVKHNVGDVEILEKLHDKLDFTRKWTRRGV